MSDRNDEITRLLSEIKRCEEEKNAAQRRYAQQLQELKLELAKVCGHINIRRDWVWGECIDCGFTDLITLFGFANSIRVGRSG